MAGGDMDTRLTPPPHISKPHITRPKKSKCKVSLALDSSVILGIMFNYGHDTFETHKVV